jgi:TolB-like protein
LLALVAALAAGAGLLARLGPKREALPPLTPELEQQVVVAPFRVSGASASLAYLREGMVELLSTRLADDSNERSVDAGAVLAAWRAAGLGGTSDEPRSTIARLAAGLGAERVVTGSVVGTQSRIVLTAGVTDAATGRLMGQASVEGAADSITSLVDRLAARLLVLDAGEEASLATRTSESLPALRAFLDGQAAFRRGNYTGALRRAIQLDSTHRPSRELLAREDLDVSGDTATRPGARGASTELQLAPFLRWRSALRRGDGRALRRFRDTLPALGPRNLRAIASFAQREGTALGDARLALEQLRAAAIRAEDRIEAALAQHALALNQGQRRAAAIATERLGQLGPASQTRLRLQVLDALYGDDDAAIAAEAAAGLQRSVGLRDVADPAARAVQIANACVLAQWRLAQGDTTGVRELVGRLRDAPFSAVSLAPPVAAAPRACGELLEAALVVARADKRAAEVLARLDSFAFTVGSSGDAIAWAPILIARLHARVGQTEAALAALRRREDRVGWPRYLATAWREEARYAAGIGRVDEARQALGRYLALRQAADSDLTGTVEAVRRDSVALGRVPR